MDIQTHDDASSVSLDGFIGRQAIRERFEQLLLAARPKRLRLLAIKGNSGTGKSTLIDYLRVYICPRLGWQSGTIIFDKSKPEFSKILNSIEDILKECVPRSELETYRAKQEAYIHTYNQRHIIINQNIEASDHASVSAASQGIKTDQLERELELERRSELTEILIRLAEHCETPFCLFIDDYQRFSSSDLIDWFWTEVVFRLANASPLPVVGMTCGWEYPALSSIEPYTEFLPALEDFDRDEVKSYLEHNAVMLEGQQDALIDAFYGLTKGHPLVLGLAVTYFQELPADQRTIDMLRAPNVLENVKAQTRFIQGRLLQYIAEPTFSVLVCYGPILRVFDQSALQALLQVEIVETRSYEQNLDDQTYDKFLRYPFITMVGDRGYRGQRTFHDIVRSVQLDDLRTHHAPTVETLHKAMATYYLQVADDEVESLSETEDGETSMQFSLSNFVIPERAFRAYLEHVYHAFQVPKLRQETFDQWHLLTRAIIYVHCRQATKLLEAMRQHGEQSGQAEALLAVVKQLIDEGNEFFQPTSDNYGHYLLLYANFLEQEGSWQESREKLEQALEIFKSIGNNGARAICLNNLGLLYRDRGVLTTAAQYMQESLDLVRTEHNPATIALILNNLAVVCQDRGLHEQALRYLQEAMPMYENVEGRSPISFALLLNNIGQNLQMTKQFDRAYLYYGRAITAAASVGDIVHIAMFLNNMGGTYEELGKLDQALDCYKDALPHVQKAGYVAYIAQVLENIGDVYAQLQGQEAWTQAIAHYEEALPYFEKSANVPNTVSILGKISIGYRKLGEWETALAYLERLYTLCEEYTNNAGLAIALAAMGSIYWEQRQTERAIDHYQRALPLFDEKDNISDKAEAFYTLGKIYQAQHDIEQALQYFKQAIQLDERSHDIDRLRHSLGETGLIYLQQQKWKLSLQYYKQIHALLEHTPQSEVFISVLNTVGALSSKLQEWTRAFAYHEQALQLSQQINNAATIGLSFYHLGEYCCERGQWDLALSYHKRALSMREQAPNADDLIHSLNRIGSIYSVQEQWKNALHYCERARKVAADAGFHAIMPSLLNTISSVYYAQGNITQALSYCDLAIDLTYSRTESTEDNAALLALLNNKGEIDRNRGRLPEALASHQHVLAAYQQQQNHAGIAISLINMAGCYYAQENLTQADECLKQALSACVEANDLSLLATYRNNKGSILRHQGQLNPAAQEYERAYKSFERIGSTGNAALTAHNLGVIYRQQHETRKAAERHQRALDLYERLGHVTDLTAIEALETLAQCYTQLNEPEKAAQYLIRAQHARDKWTLSAESRRQPHVLIRVQNSAAPFSFTCTDIYATHFTWIDEVESGETIRNPDYLPSA